MQYTNIVCGLPLWKTCHVSERYTVKLIGYLINLMDLVSNIVLIDKWCTTGLDMYTVITSSVVYIATTQNRTDTGA